MQALACDKPDGATPQYFELYKQTTVGTLVTKVCLGGLCVGVNGYARSAPYTSYTCTTTPPVTTPPTCTPATEVCDGKDNNCNGLVDENSVCTPTPAPACATSAFTAKVTCTSTITKDVSSGGCRTVVCGTSGNTITTLACDKSGYYEVYRQAATGTPPKVCFGTVCVQYEGYAKSALCTAPTCTPATEVCDGKDNNCNGLVDENNVCASTPAGTFPLKTNIVSTIFWVGQGPSADTGGSNNYDSAWDVWWQEHYGGYDDPNSRNGYYPKAFTPKENPFYVAIPYTDFSTTGRKANAFSVVPWSKEKAAWGAQESMIKNRWVRVIKGTKTVYAQVENAGPGPTDDWPYAFGSNPQPTTSFGWRAGIDVSPAVRDYLGLGPVDNVSWQWVNASQVPTGPWKSIVTTRQSCWSSTICP
jgi:hypothetical protein